MMIELTNMCLVRHKDKILFLNREKASWPGITFPGGHVEENESIYDSVKREIKEETGLDLINLRFVDIIEWNTKPNRELSLLFTAESTDDRIISSEEGKAFFSTLNEIDPSLYSEGFTLILKRYNLI